MFAIFTKKKKKSDIIRAYKLMVNGIKDFK